LRKRLKKEIDHQLIESRDINEKRCVFAAALFCITNIAVTATNTLHGRTIIELHSSSPLRRTGSNEVIAILNMI
jgi:hypothetical protein